MEIVKKIGDTPIFTLKQYFLRPKKLVGSILWDTSCQGRPILWLQLTLFHKPLMSSSETVMFAFWASTNVTAAMDRGKVVFEIYQKTQKVGNFITKRAKPKLSKIRQKSNFGPIVKSHI